MAKITNNAPGVRIVNAKVDGKVVQVSLRSGETKDLDVIETKGHKARVESGVFTVSGGKKAETPPSGPQAVHRGAGSFSVMDGDKELVEKLTKEDADAFNKLDDAAKAKFIADRKAA